MKSKMIRASFTVFTVIMVTCFLVDAQTNYQSNATRTTVKGTSTLHDWEMTSGIGRTRASLTSENGQVTSISALSFAVAAESLKSDKSALDKNAYKALNTDKYNDIKFTMAAGTVTSTGKNTFQVKMTGNLTIAGNTRPTTLMAIGRLNPAEKSISVNGSTKFRMTEYQVKPPTVMMGTIKTGDEISINYDLTLTTK